VSGQVQAPTVLVLTEEGAGCSTELFGLFEGNLLAPAGNQIPDVELFQFIANYFYLKYVPMYILLI
jgi:hypothetical protein